MSYLLPKISTSVCKNLQKVQKCFYIIKNTSKYLLFNGQCQREISISTNQLFDINVDSLDILALNVDNLNQTLS